MSLLEPGSVKTELLGRNRRVARRALVPERPYYQWFQRLQDLLDQLGDTPATSGVDVAKAVHNALTDERPRLRYVVGRRAKLLLAVRRYLPGELFERVWMKELTRRMTGRDAPLDGLV